MKTRFQFLARRFRGKGNKITMMGAILPMLDSSLDNSAVDSFNKGVAKVHASQTKRTLVGRISIITCSKIQ